MKYSISPSLIERNNISPVSFKNINAQTDVNLGLKLKKIVTFAIHQIFIFVEFMCVSMSKYERENIFMS